MPTMKNRRDFLMNCLRGGALLALAGLTAQLAKNSLHGTCQRTNPCGVCPLLEGCGLPKAIDAKTSVARTSCPEPSSSIPAKQPHA